MHVIETSIPCDFFHVYPYKWLKDVRKIHNNSVSDKNYLEHAYKSMPGFISQIYDHFDVIEFPRSQYRF